MCKCHGKIFSTVRSKNAHERKNAMKNPLDELFITDKEYKQKLKEELK